LRALDAEDLSPLEALRHPWLEDRELRLAYGEHRSARGDPLGEWIAAATRLEEPDGLSSVAEWNLRQRAWSLLEAHGETWTQGSRSDHEEFARELGHPWRLAKGRLEPCPWKVTPGDFGESNRAKFEARGEPALELDGVPGFSLRSLAERVVERPWLQRLSALQVRLEEDWPWTEEDDAAFDADQEAFALNRERAHRRAAPPVDLRALAALLPGLRRFELRKNDFLKSWGEALSARLEAFACYGSTGALGCLLELEWPRLRRLEVSSFGMSEGEAIRRPPDRLDPARLPRLEELAVGRQKPPVLGPLAQQLRVLTLQAPIPMLLGGLSLPAQGMLTPVLESNLVRLRELDLYGYRTSGWHLEQLARLPALRALELGNTGLDDQDAKALGRLEGLRRLSIGYGQPLTGKGLAELLRGPLSRTLRDLDLRGGHGCCGPTRSHYSLGGAQTLHDIRGHSLTSLALPYLTRRSARVLATAPALRGLCELRVSELRGEVDEIHQALTQKAVFRLTRFEVDSPRSNAENQRLRELWGWRYTCPQGDYDFDFSF
jgi:hypothetical protein